MKLSDEELAILEGLSNRLKEDNSAKRVIFFAQDEKGGLHELAKMSQEEARDMVESYRDYKSAITFANSLRKFMFFIALPSLAVYEFFKGKISIADLLGVFKP